MKEGLHTSRASWRFKLVIAVAVAVGIFLFASRVPGHSQLSKGGSSAIVTSDGNHYDYADPPKDMHAWLLATIKDRGPGYYTTDLTPEWRTNRTLQEEVRAGLTGGSGGRLPGIR